MEFTERKKSLELVVEKRQGVNSEWLQKRLETPSTPGRPLFSFNTGNMYRKNIPSKWDNAEKWLMSSSCNESPAHVSKSLESPNFSKSNEAFAKKQNFTRRNSAFYHVSSESLKDKFTDSEGAILFKDLILEPEKKTETLVSVLQSRDVGTEIITPLCSLNTSCCHTPMKSSSPARHNTPADMSGCLVASSSAKINISELKNFHFAQYDSMFCNWSSKEEEEEEVSKSLRHFEMNDGRKSIAESRASLWEEEERVKSCIRYQREEAKIQAWVNLQTAKAEEKSKKLEVKIQNMRSNLEEKVMKRMAVVHRRSEEWRAEAQLQHSQQLLKAAVQVQKMRSQQSSYLGDDDHHQSCGCFTVQQ